MNKIYTLDEVDNLIQRYKKYEKKEDLSELLGAFEGFIVKYTCFLKYGRYTNNDRDLISLIGLLNPKNEDAINLIKNIFNSWEYEDIFNELNFIFIKSIKQFTKKKEGPFFAGYLYNYYKFMVKEWIEKISKDIYNRERVWIEDLDNIKNGKQDNIEQNEYENLCLTKKTDLTQLEKSILYFHYGKKVSIANISEMFGLQRSYINRIKNKAKEKLLKSGITLDDFEKS